MIVFPTNNGTVALQLAVPDALPAPPFDVLQRTAEIATSSNAVPLTAIDAADVETIVEAGERIRSAGGVVSLALGGAGGSGGSGMVGPGGAGGFAGGVAPPLPYKARIPAMSSDVKAVANR
jgi:hypothetical protein